MLAGMNSEPPPWTPSTPEPGWPHQQPPALSASEQQYRPATPSPWSSSQASTPTSAGARPVRAGAVVTAALLLGALAGGAAGVGGAALFDQTSTAQSRDQTPLTRSGADTSVASSEADPAAQTAGAVEAAAAEALPSVVKIYASGAAGNGSGSGIILTEEGQILTNNHVVEVAADGGKLAVSFSDGVTAEATILGRDPLTDLAVIHAEDVSGRTSATLGDSDSLAVGDQVVAVGAPFGLESTVTSGIVSALNRPVTTGGAPGARAATVFPAIQTDAAINPGNSGGPLVDASGMVVAVSTALAQSAQGIFFAIPINIAKPIMRQAVAGEPLSRPWIGIIYVSIDRNAAEQNDLPIDYGAWIAPDTSDGSPPVLRDSPAADAGLQANDIVTAIDGRRIDAAQGLDDILSLYEPGDRLTLSVLREGATLQMGLTLGTRPAGLD